MLSFDLFADLLHMLTSGTPAAICLSFEKVSLIDGFLCPTVAMTVPIPAAAFVVTLWA